MTNYSRGRKFEWSVRDEFIAAGWVVVRSAGSHTPMDLIAIRADETGMGCPISVVAFVQCKGGSTRISSSEWNVLVDEAVKCNAYAILVDRPSPRKRTYWRITGARAPRSRARPCVEFRP